MIICTIEHPDPVDLNISQIDNFLSEQENDDSEASVDDDPGSIDNLIQGINFTDC